jgi:hypothetical protein
MSTIISLAEQWAEEDLEDERNGERAQLLRAYDRRKVPTPIQVYFRVPDPLAQLGWPELERSAEYWVSRLAEELLADFAELRRDDPSREMCECARRVAVCHDHHRYDPNWGDPEVTLHAEARESDSHLALARDIFSDLLGLVPVDPKWFSETAVLIAKGMYESRDFSAMPILADALQDAGCDSDDILSHCRDEKQTHVRGCWVVDLVLGKS